MKKKIIVGLDFDGVVAYNPFRVIRPVVKFIKGNVFGAADLNFWYPKHRWQQIFWTILHESSVLPARGIGDFKYLVEEGIIEAHLVTARYSFLDNHLYRWLEKFKLRKYFKSVNLNKNDEQPHLFKEKIINKNKLDIFIEDNLDIVRYLQQGTKNIKHKTKIFWIYNLFDRNERHPYKYPYLGKALLDIIKSTKSLPV